MRRGGGGGSIYLPDDLRELHGQPVADHNEPDVAQVLGLGEEAERVEEPHLLLGLLLGELPLLAPPFLGALERLVCVVKKGYTNCRTRVLTEINSCFVRG